MTQKCIELGCNKQSAYNYENEKPLYCGKHKNNNMIDVKNKKCIEINCKIRPNYNFEGETIALYCKKHKKDNMVDIKHKTCIEKGCKTRPGYNFKGEKAIYCKAHKKDNMIDVTHKPCIEKNCIILPSYNYENEKKAIYCKSHKKDNMIEIVNKKCAELGCKTRPCFNYENETIALYCEKHKKSDMKNILSNKCKTPACDLQITKKYNGYCLRCFIYNFPNSKLIKNYGTKESKVSEFIKKEFGDLNITYNKTIDGGCSKFRPDILIECLTHTIIVEVDENQHKSKSSYTPECEISRLNNIFTDLADRPIVFIRFNPDSYKTKKKEYPSCFERTEDKGLLKANMVSLNPRLKKLKEEINKNLSKVPEENICNIYMYYDKI